ncbi:MAG: hypothetical protein LCH85_22390 [Chloroflexi bacterium]|nr:hypothetical protein [Chloroflexota bacterium]
MQPHRERATPKTERNWWRFLPVLGAIGLIGLMLVLTFMPSSLDETSPNPGEVALLGSATPSIQPSATIVAAPFPTTILEQPPIQVVPTLPTEVSQPPTQPIGTITLVPTPEPSDLAVLPTIVPIIEQPAVALPSATVVLQTTTPLPTSTARPAAGETELYAIINNANLEQYQLVQLEPTGLVTIATVDQNAEELSAILPEQQSLFLARNQTLFAIDLTTGLPRWSYPLLPKSNYDYQSSLTVDQAGTGVYLLDHSSLDQSWRLSHLNLADGRLLNPPQQLSPMLHSISLVGDGKLWFVDDDKLYRLDPETQTQRDFGAVSDTQILSDGRQAALAVFRSPTKLSLIDWANSTEHDVTLATPFQGTMLSAKLSYDQTILLVKSFVENVNPRLGTKYFYAAYDLQNGALIAIREVDSWTFVYPTTIGDQWLIKTIDFDRSQQTLHTWNVATNSLTKRIEPSVLGEHGVAWIGEVAGATLTPLNQELQVAVAPLPTQVPIFEQPALPTIQPPVEQPIAIFSDIRVSSLQLRQFNSDQSVELLSEQGMGVFPRYNQSPLLLQRPQSKIWQLTDLVTQQSAQWEFEKPINPENFNSLLAPSAQSMLAVVGQDLRSNDQFTGASQLIHINVQTGQWDIVADSRTWSDLKWSYPIAWQGDTVYFLQTSKNPQILWRVQLGPPFQAEKIAEIPSILANIPDVDSAIMAQVYISPNQRWLLYPLATGNKTMVIRVLDLSNQRSHDIALPLMSLYGLSFSPEGNSFAFMLPHAERGRYPALYQFEQQRWYQLDANSYPDSGESPFLWSPDGHWLALDLSNIGGESQLSVYNAQQPSLAFTTNFDSINEPLALYNDGKTILARHFWQTNLEQLTWNRQEWQINWRVNDDIVHSDSLYYVYPR